MIRKRSLVRRTAAVTAAGAAALVLAACGGNGDDDGSAGHGGHAATASSSAPASASASASASQGQHNAADVAFATGMIPHHRQAVEMADLAPDRAGCPAYAGTAGRRAHRGPRRAYVMLGLLFTAVLLPLAANTVATVLLNTWTLRAKSAAERWLTHSPGATVTSVDTQSRTLYIHVRGPDELPPIKSLLNDLEGEIPDGIPIVVDTTRGQQITAGRVGG
ncbi:hypothetical protein STENM36S_04828 [Streptomyces tendae]